jgi:3-phosphoshikimate 1-carboxyvinyltransferase
MPLFLEAPAGPLSGTVCLPPSKSLANRQLILRALSGVTLPDPAPGLPEDVRLLIRLLGHPGPVWDAGAGGTTLRFLLAYLALQDRRGTVTGSARMLERPIGPLVEALNALGARVRYAGETGYPPLILEGFAGQAATRVTLDASLSSQFASALLLSAAALPEGLELRFDGAVTSRPYLTMTLRLLREAGVLVTEGPDVIRVDPGGLRPFAMPVEADWTAASYPYALVALAPEGSMLFLPGLRASGWQGDQVLHEWMAPFGVESRFLPDGVQIRRVPRQLPERVDLDFRDHPDLAQTLVVLCASLGIPGRFRGLHTLALKETDRTQALARELRKTGVQFMSGEEGEEGWILAGRASAPAETLCTWDDHRMAMALSLVSMKGPIRLDDGRVVAKSFPGWWGALAAIGFQVHVRSDR